MVVELSLKELTICPMVSFVSRKESQNDLFQIAKSTGFNAKSPKFPVLCSRWIGNHKFLNLLTTEGVAFVVVLKFRSASLPLHEGAVPSFTQPATSDVR